MRYMFRFLCTCALGVVPVAGCFQEELPCGSCEGVVCPDDGNECTRAVCNCGHCYQYPEVRGAECDFEGGAGICIAGVCEADPCEGVVCDDNDLCTEDWCYYEDVTCRFTPIVCDDEVECTEGMCDPTDGMCDFTTAEDGTICITLEPSGAEPLGMCEAGACSGPCDPESEEELPCPIEGVEDFFCCPGWEACLDECIAAQQ